MTAELRRLPSVVEVQSPSDLLPPLDERRLGSLRAGLAALRRFPDLERLRQRGATVSELLPAVSGLGDAVDEVAFALRQGGRPAQAADEVKEAIASLKQVLKGLPDDGRAALKEAEAGVASVIERALTSARKVARRGSYLPEDLPPLFRTRFVSHDGAAVALYAYPAGDIWQREVSKRFADDVESVDPEATGPAVSVYQHERMVVEGFLRAALLALVLVVVTLWIDFRDVKATALAMIPLVAGWMWMLGMMRVAGLSFNVANIVVLPLLLGLGIDAGAQIIHRHRDSLEQHGGKARLTDLVCGTGSAILTTYLTTIMGFAALMVGDYGAMLSLGLMMTIGLSFCLAASLLLLPAVLLALGLVE
jgi:predicted RND superfamily exporter protein